jgi:uncharacterized protein with NAD-binding domain and iron-sulfur cluster
MVATVAVLGGGVAGLSAAHELARRGYKVTLYEKRALPGGKARSYPTPNGRPAEHGFRFFPGFYRHLPDTMKCIPSGSRSAFDRLVGTGELLIAQAGGREDLIAPAQIETIDDLIALREVIRRLADSSGLQPQEGIWLLNRLLVLLASCDERREHQWDLQSWWEFVEADGRSVAFRNFLADGLTRTLVAARGNEMSARTGGLILFQLLLDLARSESRFGRVLDAPTNDAWIDPWVEYLRGLGVAVRLMEPVEGISVRGNRVSCVSVGGRTVVADYYVAALPVEVMRTMLSPELRRAEPRLNGLDALVTRWMNGVIFYLAEDLPLVHGHAIYVDSEWALTSISQRQFWGGVDFNRIGVGGILSVDISEWQRPGGNGKVAAQCTAQEIRDEVWRQLRDHLDARLDSVKVTDWFLDESIEFPNPSTAVNAEPLLVNTKGSWAHRPDATTRIPNLMLAADYVRTYTDLATMEGANEAARCAVNAILDATGSSEARCCLWPLHEPPILARARALDKLLWRLHRPACAPVRFSPSGTVRPIGIRGRTMAIIARCADRL